MVNLVPGCACRPEAVAVGSPVALTGGIYLHDFGDNASASPSNSCELLFSESVAHYDESIPIKNSLCVFNPVGGENLETDDAIISVQMLSLVLQFRGVSISPDPPVARSQGQRVIHSELLSPGFSPSELLHRAAPCRIRRTWTEANDLRERFRVIVQSVLLTLRQVGAPA